MLPLTSAASMGEAGLPGGPVGRLRQPSRPRGWSGQRDSNPRHQAWEACTLPAELCPLNAQQVYLINSRENVKAFSGLRLDSPTSPAGPRPLSPFAEKKVSVQRSAFSHQLNERIQEDMIGDKVDHFSSDSLNFLFLLKADC